MNIEPIFLLNFYLFLALFFSTNIQTMDNEKQTYNSENEFASSASFLTNTKSEMDLSTFAPQRNGPLESNVIKNQTKPRFGLMKKLYHFIICSYNPEDQYDEYSKDEVSN